MLQLCIDDALKTKKDGASKQTKEEENTNLNLIHGFLPSGQQKGHTCGASEMLKMKYR